MPLGKFLKRDKDEKELRSPTSPSPPEFKFIRSDTNSETVIHPPTGFPGEHGTASSSSSGGRGGNRSRSSSNTGSRLRQSLHFGHHRKSDNNSSVNVPELPNIEIKNLTDADWEHRATLLAKASSPTVPTTPGRRSRASSVASARVGDDDTIQEAIRLHESQQYEQATALFRKLADPNGGNNVLSQVIYALCLRHGWGCTVDEVQAAEYLRMAANNAADIEEEALRAGVSKGGAAKGELVLAIYELANCYRQGWGVPKDLNAAFQYYLTAANLGDSDAMNEVALCYLEGYGCKKNKYEAARYYRLAEAKGNKTVGNSWIYKDKYIKYEKEGGKKK